MNKLTNGTYIVQHKQLNTRYKMVINKGKWTLYSLINDQYLKTINRILYYEFYSFIDKIPSKPSNYNIEYWVGCKLVETIPMNMNYAIVKAKMNMLQRTSGAFRSGVLKMVKCG